MTRPTSVEIFPGRGGGYRGSGALAGPQCLIKFSPQGMGDGPGAPGIAAQCAIPAVKSGQERALLLAVGLSLRERVVGNAGHQKGISSLIGASNLPAAAFGLADSSASMNARLKNFWPFRSEVLTQAASQ